MNNTEYEGAKGATMALLIFMCHLSYPFKQKVLPHAHFVATVRHRIDSEEFGFVPSVLPIKCDLFDVLTSFVTDIICTI